MGIKIETEIGIKIRIKIRTETGIRVAIIRSLGSAPTVHVRIVYRRVIKIKMEANPNNRQSHAS